MNQDAIFLIVPTLIGAGLFGIFFVLVVVGIIWLFMRLKKMQLDQEREIHKIAESRGLTYWNGDPAGRYADSKVLCRPATRVLHALSSESEGIDTGLVVNTGPKKGSKLNEDTAMVHDYTRVQLPRESHMYLLVDSQRNNFLGFTIKLLLEADKTLREFVLEGDFPQNYKVYGVIGSQIETLQLLNPKAMLELVEKFTSYDIEITGTSVYMYSIGLNSMLTEEMIDERFDDARRVRDFILKHLPMESSAVSRNNETIFTKNP